MQTGIDNISRSNEIGQKWAKAAVIGSIWAAIEIVAGSFLHNLRLPFSGTMLSMAAVFLIVAFAMHWKDRGIIIRAGLIAAVMKSISPSAVILGPMVAITMEAMIFEIILTLMGRNLAGFISAGMLAVAWALIQRVITLLIVYGFDLVKIAEAFYFFLVKVTGLENMPPLYLLILVLIIYMSAGTLAALAGFYSYKQHLKRNSEPGKNENPQSIRQNPFEILTLKQRYGTLFLAVILAGMVAILYFLNANRYLLAGINGSIFVVFVLLRYKRAIRYIRKPGLWIQLLLITLIASFLWEWIDTGTFFSSEGLIIGLELMARALVIILGFSAISVELRNPVIRSILYRNGLSYLYKSVTVAFNTLPAVIEILPEKNRIFRDRRRLLSSIIQLSDILLIGMLSEEKMRTNIFIITGSVHTGKTTFLEKTIMLLEQEKMKVAGILSKGTFKDGKRDSFEIHDPYSKRKFLLASRVKRETWLQFSSFYFDPEGFSLGKQFIQEGIENNADVLVLDEIGPVEMRGEGWCDSIKLLLSAEKTPQLWVVREKLLKEVCDRWNIPQQNVVDITGTDPAGMVEHISEFYKA